jgi:uncharacterized OsmC-like protein
MERFEWTVRVRAGDADRASVFARKHRFDVGPPVEFDVEADHVSAVEYLLGAVGADLAVGLRRLAHQRRLVLDGVEAVVQGSLDDPAAYLGAVGAEGHPGLGRLGVKVYVSTAEAEPRVREVWDEALRRSPLLRTLGAAVPFEIDLKVTM